MALYIIINAKKTNKKDEIINFYELPEIKQELYIHENPNFNDTQIKVPFRMACIAISGAGKSNFLVNLIKLFTEGDGTFSHIHILHKIPEYLYDFLAKKSVIK